MAEASNTPIGNVLVVYGEVKAISPEGMERVLDANSPVFENERVLTGADGSISIMFEDGQTQLDLGKFSNVQLDADVYTRLDDAEIENSIADVDQIQQALEDGNFDPTTQLEATAAGPTAAGANALAGGGRETVEFTPDAQEVTPDSGAETIGLTRDFLDPPTIIIEGEPETAPLPTPAAPAIAPPPVPPEPPLPEPPQPEPEQPQPEPPQPKPEPPQPEPEPPQPEPEPPQPEPKPFADPDEALTVSENAPLMGDDGLSQSGNLLDNVQDAITPVISAIEVKNAAGEYERFEISGTGTTVDIYQDGLKTGTLEIKRDGSYTYNLDNRANHNLPEKYGENDDVTLDAVKYTVTDTTTGLTDDSTLTITIEDGAPEIKEVGSVVLGNEGGNSITENFTTTYGTDGQAPEETGVQAIQLLDKNGESLIGKEVVDSNGTPLTSGGEKLLYSDDGNGGVIAVNSEGQTVFTVEVTPPTAAGETEASYTVTLSEENLLDNHTISHEQTAALEDGQYAKAAVELDGGVIMTISGYDDGDNAAELTINEGKIGVDSPEINNDKEDSIDWGEHISIDFTNDAAQTIEVEQTSFTIQSTNYSQGNWVKVEAYDAEGNLVGDVISKHLLPEEPQEIVINEAVAKVVVSPDGITKKCAFTIETVKSEYSTDEPQDIEYSVKITDGDIDTVPTTDGEGTQEISTGDTDTSNVFTITFQGDKVTDNAAANADDSGDDTSSSRAYTVPVENSDEDVVTADSNGSNSEEDNASIDADGLDPVAASDAGDSGDFAVDDSDDLSSLIDDGSSVMG